MPRINIISNIGDKLNSTYLTDAQIKRVVLAVQAYRNVSDDVRSFIVECFEVLASGDSTFKKESIVRMVQEVASDPTNFKYLRISQGAQFCYEFTLNTGEDFTGSFLTARNAEDNTLLSPNNIAGDSQVNDPVQEIEISDLSLTAGSFYQVDYLTEGDTAGAANGEAGTLLATIWFLVTRNIDSA